MAHTSVYPPRAAASVPLFHAFLIKKARLPKMHMNINKTRYQQLAPQRQRVRLMQIGNTGNAASVYGYIRPHQLSSMIHRRAVQPKVHDHRPLSVFIRCVYPIIYDTQRQVVCQAMVRGFSQTLRPAPPVVSYWREGPPCTAF